jgi:hypothetical protein
MSGFVAPNEYHIVRVELKGPKKRQELARFNEALARFVEANGGTVRFQGNERGPAAGRRRRRPRKAAKRRKR